MAWLESATVGAGLEGTQFAVFGCGNREWKNTFQRIPTLVDDVLAYLGSKRIVERGLSDAAQNSTFSDFDNWTDKVLWPALAPDSAASGAAFAELEVEMSTQNRSAYLRQDVRPATVVQSKCLTARGEPEKRHVEIKLPEDQTYQTGDYLAVLPLNPMDNVSRVMKHFKIAEDATINIKPGSATFLPTAVPISVVDLLRGFVELGQPATEKDLQACIDATKDTVERETLKIFLEDEGFKEVAEQRVSLIDILNRYPSVQLSFGLFISMLPPLRPRHYSISSSPLQDPSVCSITFGVLDEPALSGVGQFVGVTSTYLSSLKEGDEILVSVRATNKFFHLPTDPECPILMFGAGTGLAPFRGFIQERAIQLEAGRKLAPALMFMGCRSETADRLYAEELDAWCKAGAVDVRYAFSKDSKSSKGCKYVQNRILEDKEDVLRMWRSGAKVFVCGGPEVSTGISDVAKLLLMEKREEHFGEMMTEEQAEEWFRQRRNERYVVDVFA